MPAVSKVDRIEHLWIPLPGGTRLAARLWRPRDHEGALPALVEYLPYRKSDGTAPTDPVRHAFFAANGFASLRIDIRGSGDSDGFLLDEYHPQEARDAVDAIAWIAAQPWCNGRVGLFGISWGGFNALQIAAHRPPSLRAIVSACSTDDRYTDDVHYIGGCVEALDMLSWATQLTSLQARPPHPHVRADWRRVWLERIDALPHFAARWLAHPLRDRYWQPGSVCEDYAAIECPVLLVGGWADAYTNAIPRLLAGLSVPRQAIIGPWAHAWPNAARPGPTIDFNTQCLRWWRRWLCAESIVGDSTVEDSRQVASEPMLRVWMQHHVAPNALQKHRPGRWIAEPFWPPNDARRLLRTLRMHSHLQVNALVDAAPPRFDLAIHTDLEHGGSGGAWCPFGARGDFPSDQRADNARALCFEGMPGHADEEILGIARLRLQMQVDHAHAQLTARLCDVAPDGSALLVTRGVLNLSHRTSDAGLVAHDVARTCIPGTAFAATICFDFIAHRLPAGHRWLLALAPSYWPMVWPAPAMVCLRVHAGTLELPLRIAHALDDSVPAFGEADGAEALALATLRSPSLTRTRRVESGVRHDTHRLDGGEHAFDDGWTVGSRSEDEFKLGLAAPTSASVYCSREATQRMTHDGIDLRSVIHAQMHSDATHFILDQSLELFENGVSIRMRRWHARLPRGGA